MKDEDKYAELFKYCSPKSIMVITWYGKLKTLYCPITVKVETKVGNLAKGSYQQVEEVLLTNKGVTVFMIKKQPYYYYYFDILTHL